MTETIQSQKLPPGFSITVKNGQIVTNPGYRVVVAHDDCLVVEIDCKTKRGDTMTGSGHDGEKDYLSVLVFANADTIRHGGETDEPTEITFEHPPGGFWCAMAEMSRYTIYVTIWKDHETDNQDGTYNR